MKEPFEKLLSGKTFQALSALVYQHSRIKNHKTSICPFA
jgi:hypothetical protein